MILRKVLCDRKAVLADEQEAVAVFIRLHLVAGADPASLLNLLRLVRIEITRAERFAELILMQR
jgi:hypothetical protein